MLKADFTVVLGTRFEQAALTRLSGFIVAALIWGRFYDDPVSVKRIKFRYAAASPSGP
jgi:hypothetical protein